MMIDDEAPVAEMLQNILEEHGYKNFIHIDDSRDAIKAIESRQPDVLLLDLQMPVVDGLQLLERLREDARTEFLSVIVLTSTDDALTKLRVLELGATDFLAKPIDPSELVLRLRNTLTIKAYQDKLANYDALTGLPNRKLFLERTAWAITFASHENHQVGVINVAIDRFQQVNNSLGTHCGDQLLKKIAERLVETIERLVETIDSCAIEAKGSVGSSWRNIARLSGDEFSLLLPIIKNKSANNIIMVADSVRENLKKVFLLDDNEVYIT